MERQDIDSLIGEIRRKVVKGSKPTRHSRLRSCLRVLDPKKASDVGQSSFSESTTWNERLHPRGGAGRFGKSSHAPPTPASPSLASQVAQTTMQQIKASLPMMDFLAMGLKNVYALTADNKISGSDATGPGVQFDARGHWKGRVIVRLSPDDTYTATFGRIRGSKWKIDKEVAGIYADSIGEVVRNNVLGTGIRKESTENPMNLNDAISRFRQIDEANIPAPAVDRKTPGNGKQTSSKSKFDQYKGADKKYDGSAASVPPDKEAMAAAVHSTAGVSGPGYNGSGREKVDTRYESLEQDGTDMYENNDPDGDVEFATSMLDDKIGFFPSMEQQLAEQNLAAPSVSRKTPDGKAQISSKSKFRQPKGVADKKYDGSSASIQADKEAMDAAINSTDGVDGEGYTPDGREEIDVRGE